MQRWSVGAMQSRSVDELSFTERALQDRDTYVTKYSKLSRPLTMQLEKVFSIIGKVFHTLQMFQTFACNFDLPN